MFFQKNILWGCFSPIQNSQLWLILEVISSINSIFHSIFWIYPTPLRMKHRHCFFHTASPDPISGNYRPTIETPKKQESDSWNRPKKPQKSALPSVWLFLLGQGSLRIIKCACFFVSKYQIYGDPKKTGQQKNMINQSSQSSNFPWIFCWYSFKWGQQNIIWFWVSTYNIDWKHLLFNQTLGSFSGTTRH